MCDQAEKRPKRMMKKSRRRKKRKGEYQKRKVMKKQRKGEEGRSRKEGREGPSPSADKRQKWMNPIGRRDSSSLLSSRLHELRTHFIEICEIRKAGYRVIYHRATPAHTSSQLHNKSHN